MNSMILDLKPGTILSLITNVNESEQNVLVSIEKIE